MKNDLCPTCGGGIWPGRELAKCADAFHQPERKEMNFDFYDGDPEGFHIGSWSPTPQTEVDAGAKQAPSTQVHLTIPTALGKMVMRFKGPGTLDRLIAALMKHRVDVWGVPQDHKIWMKTE